MTNEFEEAQRGAVSSRQIDHGRMARFVTHDLTQADIEEMYNPYELAQFWEEFRVLYLNANNDVALFLERLEDSATGMGTTALDRGNATPVVRLPGQAKGKQTKEGTTIEPLPEPFIPRAGRGRGNAPREQSPVVRLVRSIGRIFGFGNK